MCVCMCVYMYHNHNDNHLFVSYISSNSSTLYVILLITNSYKFEQFNYKFRVLKNKN